MIRTFGHFLVSLLATVLMPILPACDAGIQAAEKAPQTGSQEAPGEKPSAEQSRFLADLDKEKYPEDKTRTDALTIRFDFSGKRIYAFDFSQQVENVSSMSGMPAGKSPMKQKMDAKGVMVLKSKGDKTGTLVIRDLKATMVMGVKKGEPERSVEMKPPVMAIPDVKEDGTINGGAANSQPVLRLLFPMPSKPLSPGESAEVNVNMPFNAMGSPLTVKGSMKITHRGYVTLEGKPCARLEADIDISRLEVPKELEGKYSCSAKGRSVCYFEVESQEFVSVQTALLMKMSVDGKMPDVKTPSTEKPADPPKTLQMAMESDNFIHYTRNPALAKKEAEEK